MLLTGGILILLIGLLLLLYTIKNPEKEEEYWYMDFKGYTASLTAIIVGVVFIIQYILK